MLASNIGRPGWLSDSKLIGTLKMLPLSQEGVASGHSLVSPHICMFCKPTRPHRPISRSLLRRHADRAMLRHRYL